MTIIGIDPGKNGGIAWIRDGYPCVEKMPDGPCDIRDLFREIVREDAMVVAFCEKVHSSPQMGVVSAFTFGYGLGVLHGLLAALEIPLIQVQPQKWQKEMGCLTKGDKNVSKRRAQELFPALKITHATADALLIAQYGRRLNLLKREVAQ